MLLIVQHRHSQANWGISYIFKGFIKLTLKIITAMNCYSYYMMHRSVGQRPLYHESRLANRARTTPGARPRRIHAITTDQRCGACLHHPDDGLDLLRQPGQPVLRSLVRCAHRQRTGAANLRILLFRFALRAAQLRRPADHVLLGDFRQPDDPLR